MPLSDAIRAALTPGGGDEDDELEAAHGHEDGAAESVNCPECGESFDGPMRAQRLGLHRRNEHGVVGTSRRSTSARADRSPKRRRGGARKGRPAGQAPRAKAERAPQRVPAPNRGEIQEAFELAAGLLSDFGLPESAQSMADISGISARGLADWASRSSQVARLVRLLIASLGGGIAIFGLVRVGRTIVAEIRGVRAQQPLGGVDDAAA